MADKIYDLSSIFNLCSSLSKLNISNFKKNKDNNTYSMFFGCSYEFTNEYKKNFEYDDPNNNF
jgi:hypothetical protein